MIKLLNIKDICSRFSSGKFIASNKIQESGLYPVFGGNGLRGYTDTYNFDGSCAIIGRQGAYCGNVKFFSGKAYMTEHAIVAVANKNNNSRFLAYKFAMMDLGRYAGQSAQPGLSVETLLDVNIDVPSKDVQDCIAQMLSAIDSKISSNNTISSTLESLAKLIYDYWFVQFDFPDENGKPYKSSGGKMVWNEELKREIPKGWEVVNVDQLCSITSGYPFDSRSYVDDGEYQVLTIKNIQDGYIINTTDSKISSVPYGFPECDILNIGDILMSLTGNVGRIGILCAEKFLLNQRASVINPRDSNNKWYLYFLFRNKVFFNKIQRISTGTSQKNVSPIDIGNIRILHSAKIAKLFTNKVKDLVERLILCNIENQHLASLRDFLLPMLMNGQVTIKD